MIKALMQKNPKLAKQVAKVLKAAIVDITFEQLPEHIQEVLTQIGWANFKSELQLRSRNDALFSVSLQDGSLEKKDFITLAKCASLKSAQVQRGDRLTLVFKA